MRGFNVVLATTAIAGLSSCGSLQPETYGEVSVGQPQVFSRERLLSERLSDIAWLDQQLAKPFEQGLQGIRDFREASALAVDFALSVDQAKRRLAKIQEQQADADRSRESEIAELEHKIEVVKLKKQLDALEKAAGPGTPASDVPAQAADLTKVNEALADINAKLAAIEGKLKPAAQRTNAKDLFSGAQDRILNPAAAERSSASLTNRDLFEDEFAFRDAVKARKRERVLDDTHDLSGFTLYDMKFDAAITPGSNTRQKALIEIRIDQTSLDPHIYVKPTFVERLRQRIEEDANALIVRQHQRLDAKKLSTTWKERMLGSRISDAPSACESRLATLPSPTATQDGRDLITGYVKRRLELALCKYFQFEIESRTQLLPSGKAVIAPLLKVSRRDDTEKELIDKLCRLQDRMKPWVATVEPKEYAQNISDVSSENKIRQFTLALAASGPGIEGSAEASFFKQQQELLQTIRRQPLATSFSSGGNRFGWILGPKFEVHEGKAVFVHSTARYSFGASMVVPGWFSSIKLTACGHWIGSDGGRLGTLYPFGHSCEHQVEVNLPHSHRPLLHALMDSNQDVFNAPEVQMLPQAESPSGGVVLKAMPDACALAPDKSCEQTLVIEGRELWRNPSVFVGHQKADRVDLLPSMRGIVATFNALRLPLAAPGAAVRPQDLLVATSTGEDRLEGSVFIIPPDLTLPKPFARPSAAYLDVSTPLEIAFAYAPAAFPRAYAEVTGRLRQAGSSTWITLTGDPQLSPGRLSYKIEDPSKLGLPAAPADLELDLAFRFAPGGEWVSMMQPGSRHVGYFASPVDRELKFAGSRELSFAGSEQFGEKQRQTLRAALRFALPANESMLLAAYPGLKDAMAQRAGDVRLNLTTEAGGSPIAVTMERVMVKGKPQLQPSLVSLANKDPAIVPRDEAIRSFVATLTYRRGSGEWATLPLDEPVELTITGRKKPPAPTAAAQADNEE